MKKTAPFISPHLRKRWLKTLLIMKLTTVLILITALQVSAKSYSQERVSVDFNHTNLSKALKMVEHQSSYRFVFSNDVLSDKVKVTIKAKDISVTDLLKQMLANTDLVYSVMENNLVGIKYSNAYYADKIIVKGVVTDDKGNPLPNVSVTTAKGIGATTNEKGEYSISVDEGESLTFSFVGYTPQTINVNKRNVINVILVVGANQLTDVVVVGYGTQKKVNLTGAISTISGDVLASRPIPNIGRGLQGQLPGLNITSFDGQPGRGASFNIRGFTSINGGSPLILVDGVSTDINDINPDDIESVTILKDAASAAVYGARAPFGVILITTKSGKKGTPKVNYSNNYAIHHITHLPDVVTDPNTVVTYKNEAYAGYYGTNLYNAFYTDYAKQVSQNPSLPTTIPDPSNPATSYLYFGATNWFKELYKPDNLSLNHNVSISGGGDKISYYFSGGYNQQTGVYRYDPDVYDRYNLRAKLDIKATNWLTVSTNSAYNRTTYNYPSLWTSDWTAGDLYHEIGRRNSLAILQNPDGSWTSAGAEIGFLKDGGRGNTVTNEFQNTLGFTASFFNNNWRIKGNYTFRVDNNYNRQYRVAMPYETGPDQTIKYAGHSDASNWADDINYQNINLYTEYEKTFQEKHYFKAMVGFNQELNKYDYFSAQNNQLISSGVGYLGQTTGTTPNVAGNGYDWAIRGLFYRLNYIYNDRYLLEVNGRYDGSSRFPPKDHYVFFPSVSAGWRISEEPFFNSVKNIVTNLKVRGSYGSLGNQNTTYPGTTTADYYPYIPRLGSGQVTNILGGVQPTAVYPPNLVSPTLKWEQVYSKDLGVDISFINKIDATFDLYRRDTKNMLSQGFQLPVVLGATQPLENAADLKTLGWELNLTYHDEATLFGKPFRYNVRLNLWDAHSVITRYNNPNKFWFSGGYYTGQQLGEIWGLQTLGIFQTDEEASKWADQSKLVGYYPQAAGELKYADLNGDGKINYGDGTVGNSGDARVIGNTTPRYSFGGSGGFSWNNIDFNFIFQGVGKKDFWPGTTGYYWSMFFAPWDNVYKNIIGTTWTPENPDAFYPSLKGWRAGDAGAWRDLAVPQTRYLYSGAYVRLKNITIGYSLPHSLLKRWGIDQIRIYASGEDLWESTKLPQGFDPEGLNGSWGAGKVYPFQRAYSLGLDLRF